MKCSRCGTDNPDGKTICQKCGNFLYSANPRNRVPMTPELRRKERSRKVKNATKSIVGMFFIMVAMLVLLLILSLVMLYFFGMM